MRASLAELYVIIVCRVKLMHDGPVGRPILELPVRIVPLALFAIAVCTSAAPAERPVPVPTSTAVVASVSFDAHLLVDQFGYRPRDSKIAVIRNPQFGYDSADKFSAGESYQIRSAADGTVVFAGAPRVWN